MNTQTRTKLAADENIRPLPLRRMALLRLIAGIALEVIGACVVIFGALQEHTGIFLLGMAIAMPTILLLLPVVFEFSAFHYDFGPFGSKLPRPFPSAWSPVIFSGLFAGVGYSGLRVTIPFATWYVGVEGIGLQIIGLFKVFIPAKEIVGFENRFSLLFHTSYLHHKSDEILTPLLTPREVADTYAGLTTSPFAKVTKQ